MRWSFAVAVSLGAGLLIASNLWAQRPSALPGAQTGIALVDVGAIVRTSTRLQQAIEAVKQEYVGSAETLKKEGERGNALTEQMRTMAPGPERKKMEQDLVKLRADYELHGKRVNDQASDREAKVYFSLARELQEELTRYATANGVKIVLRYEPSPPEFLDQQAIMREVQKLVVYERDSDLTPPVIDALNRRTPAASTARGTAPSKSAPR